MPRSDVAAYAEAFDDGYSIPRECLYLASSNMWEAWHLGRHAASIGYTIASIHKSRGSKWRVWHTGESKPAIWTVHEDGRVTEA